MRARFARRAFATHRHDTYAIGVTETGVQAFDYRGRAEISLPGQVVVLHPDEPHDGRPGADNGFGYRIVYVEPARVAEALQAIHGRAVPLPFVAGPVVDSPALAAAVDAAFRDPAEPLALDAVVLRLAEGLASSADGQPPRRGRLDDRALARVRAFLDEQWSVVRSADLEQVAGFSRYEVARQFRALYGTSPYRYSLMRRLTRARLALRTGTPVVEAAFAAGFAHQPHLTRAFRAAYGITPARYARLHIAAARAG
jgi:AraC-like DNA-binding protein